MSFRDPRYWLALVLIVIAVMVGHPVGWQWFAALLAYAAGVLVGVSRH